MTTILDSVTKLEGVLKGVVKGLDKRTVNHAEVEDIKAGSGMATITMVALNAESITSFIKDDAHVFYRWDHLFNQDDEEESKGLLQVFAIQNGLLYKWSMCTTEWANDQQEQSYEFEQDRLDPMRGASDELKALADMIVSRPDEFVEAYVEAATKHFDANDLSGNYHQLRGIADNVIGLRSIPYGTDARQAAQEMQPELQRAVEEHLEAKRNQAIAGLVKTFPRWYRERGSPRLSKNLVKAFAQEQGYRFPTQFVDDLKVQIDIAIARAN